MFDWTSFQYKLVINSNIPDDKYDNTYIKKWKSHYVLKYSIRSKLKHRKLKKPGRQIQRVQKSPDFVFENGNFETGQHQIRNYFNYF